MALKRVDVDYALRVRQFSRDYPRRIERELVEEVTALAAHLHALDLVGRAGDMRDDRKHQTVARRLEPFTERPETPLLDKLVKDLLE